MFESRPVNTVIAKPPIKERITIFVAFKILHDHHGTWIRDKTLLFRTVVSDSRTDNRTSCVCAQRPTAHQDPHKITPNDGLDSDGRTKVPTHTRNHATTPNRRFKLRCPHQATHTHTKATSTTPIHGSNHNIRMIDRVTSS